MRISDWSSDVCSSDLGREAGAYRRSESRRSRLFRALEYPGCGIVQVSARRSRADYPGSGEIRHAIDRRDRDRKRVVQGTSVSVRVDFGGRRMLKQQSELCDHILYKTKNDTHNY